MTRIVGIDLGTTNSRVAVMHGGMPKVIPNAEGESYTPSCVGFTKTGEIVVGAAACRDAITNPENTLYAVKRLLGSRFDDPAVKNFTRFLAYKTVKAGGGNLLIEANGQTYLPQEILALILRKLKDEAEVFLGQPVNQAVVAVPSNFSSAQRRAAKEACKIAGLECLRLTTSTLSAALAYGCEKPRWGIAAVYDLGGGAFDVSILRIGDGVFEVMSTGGDSFLGGEDFDLQLANLLVSEFANEANVDLWGQSLAVQRIRDAAERAKIELSTSDQSEILLPFLTADQSGPKHLRKRVSRQDLEGKIRELVWRATVLCERALNDANLGAGDVTDVVVVGGSARIPLVIDSVIGHFKCRPMLRPGETVALGAAIQAGVLAGDVRNVLPLDVTPIALGIETSGGIFTPVIDRNTTIPTKKTQAFSIADDGRNGVIVRVLRGERKMAAENELLAQIELVGLASASVGAVPIEVTFDIDANHILFVSAQDTATGKSKEIRISL